MVLYVYFDMKISVVKTKKALILQWVLLKKAATYSSTWCGSTIGADGLNFPVRNG